MGRGRLIDQATRERIEAFERAQKQPSMLHALAVHGGGTVALGLVSAGASNWDAIPDWLKLVLVLVLVLGAGLAAGTYAAISGKRSWAAEVLLTVFYGYDTGIGLITGGALTLLLAWL